MQRELLVEGNDKRKQRATISLISRHMLEVHMLKHIVSTRHCCIKMRQKLNAHGDFKIECFATILDNSKINLHHTRQDLLDNHKVSETLGLIMLAILK